MEVRRAYKTPIWGDFGSAFRNKMRPTWLITEWNRKKSETSEMEGMSLFVCLSPMEGHCEPHNDSAFLLAQTLDENITLYSNYNVYKSLYSSRQHSGRTDWWDCLHGFHVKSFHEPWFDSQIHLMCVRKREIKKLGNSALTTRRHTSPHAPFLLVEYAVGVFFRK